MNSHNLQTDYSPQQPPKNDANGASLILRANYQPAVSPAKAVVLNSWKEIAAYLGRGVRTVQRWEFDAGLPVHRPKGKDRSAVLALTNELDNWLCGTPVRCDGNGNRDAGSVVPDTAAVLLELARDLQTVGERMVVQMDRRHRPEAEKLVLEVGEIVRELSRVSSGNSAAKPCQAAKQDSNPA